jgi:hypothetical protein
MRKSSWLCFEASAIAAFPGISDWSVRPRASQTSNRAAQWTNWQFKRLADCELVHEGIISWPASKDVNELIFSYKICIAKNLKFDWLH